MLHRTAKLTPSGRRLLVQRILVEGWPPATAAEMVGVSRATAYKWLRRYRSEGFAGLEDRPPRPRRRPRALPEREVRRILLARRRLRVGPHSLGPLLGHPRSTVYAVLRRHGVSRLAHADRLTGAPVRYVRERPRELLHVDVKRLGRVPPGGGHRMLSDGARHHRPVGYDFLHLAIERCDARRLRDARARRAGRHDGRLRARCPRLLRGPGRTRGAAHDRQRDDLHALARARHAPRRARDPPPAHATATTADERQGGALHRDASARVGICPALPLQRRAPGEPHRLGRRLQSPPSPCRARWLVPMAELVNKLGGNDN